MFFIVDTRTNECINIFEDNINWFDHDTFIRVDEPLGEIGLIYNGPGLGWTDNRPPPDPKPEITNEQKWEKIRAARDLALLDTDWTILPDAKISQPMKYLFWNYRQALRDITLQPDPDNIVWPEYPTEPDDADTNPVYYPLTGRQLRLGLVFAGISTQTVVSAIQGIQDAQQKEVAQIWWEFSNEIHFDHPMRLTLTQLLGIPENNVIAMWLNAAKNIAP